LPPVARASRRRWLATAVLAVSAGFAPWAQADAVDTLRHFSRDVKGGQATFTQTVVSPDGERRKTSTGTFAFSRPDRFRFAYDKPFEQVIVSDGREVWLHDVDLQQVNVRPLGQALGATPAALLSGGDLERDFTLKALPDADGLSWVQAMPKAEETTVRQVKVGFDGPVLAVLELTDAFGQRSVLKFSQVQQGAQPPAELFRFTPPKGVDVLRQ
jgi:outer membrane lipoprotein carrier protein